MQFILIKTGSSVLITQYTLEDRGISTGTHLIVHGRFLGGVIQRQISDFSLWLGVLSNLHCSSRVPMLTTLLLPLPIHLLSPLLSYTGSQS